MKSIDVLIAHAPGEEELARNVAEYLGRNGLIASYRETVKVGESHTASVANLLELRIPVVLCATVRAIGTGCARHIVHAAQEIGCRIYVLQMDEEAYILDLLIDGKILRYWIDSAQALSALVKALKSHTTNILNTDDRFRSELDRFDSMRENAQIRISKSRKGVFDG